MSARHTPYRSSQPLDARWRGYRVAAWAGQALLAVAVVVVLLQGRYTGALTLAGFLVASVVFVLREDRLPNLFDMLFVIAALLAGIVGVWSLSKTP